MAPPSRRGFVGASLDRLSGKLFGLPPETSNFTTTTVSIPLRDGEETFDLAADLYQPIFPTDQDQDQKPHGTILSIGPYGRGVDMASLNARPFAARGYQVLLVSCRGTYGSGGTFDACRTEVQDGHGLVAWMRTQEWYTGSFVTFGGSYLAFTQWALLTDPPPDMVAAIALIGVHDFSRSYWDTGAMNMDMLLWSDTIANMHLKGASMVQKMWCLNTGHRRLGPLFKSLPMADAVTSYFDGKAPWLSYPLTHPDRSDPYYLPMQHGSALEKVEIPVLLISGWQDICLVQTLDQYRRLLDRDARVALIIGPWTHTSLKPHQPEVFSWLDSYLRKDGESKQRLESEPAARVYVGGVEDWRRMPQWPPKTNEHNLYLQADKRLTSEKPVEPTGNLAADSPLTSSFAFDPDDPTPTVGGPMLAGGGVVADDSLASRADVLAFTTEPLAQDMEVLGVPIVELIHASDTPHIDLFVRISDVDSWGRSQNVTEVYRRMDHRRPAGATTLTLRLRDCAHVFLKGHRVRLVVAGGNHPQFHRNPGTSDSPETASEARVATHTIHHGGIGASRLILPVPSEKSG